MFFGDEKDYNLEDGDTLNISDDDGAVTWEDVLSADDEDILTPNQVDNKQSAVSKDTNKESIANVKISDDVDLISDIDDDGDDVSDDELARILSDSSSSDMDEVEDDDIDLPKKAQEIQSAAVSPDEYDIDGQLANIVLDNDDSDEAADGTAADIEADIEEYEDEENQQAQPREYHLHENSQKAAVGGANSANADKIGDMKKVLIVFIAFIFVISLRFFFMNNFGSKDAASKDLRRPQTAQEQLDEMTQEDLEQRASDEEIPIVNEEELASIKPDETEKKQTIEVTPTGRVNPFAPLQKYVPVQVPKMEITYSDNYIPAPPQAYGIPDERIDKMITIAVSGIMYDEQRPSAIITYDNNDYFVQKGDKLDDYKVLNISKNYVVLGLGPNTYKAMVGEEFKVSQDFSGSATYSREGRQYHSSEFDKNREEEMKKPASSNRYVSEKDVTVNAR